MKQSDNKATFATVLVTFLLVGLMNKGSTQETHMFNLPGNPCYFTYVKYSPMNDYSSGKKPYIFVLGKPGQTATDVFNCDTLKNMAYFSNFMFTYIPNHGGNASAKVGCIPALASLLTYNFAYGRSNVFLYIYDETLEQADLNSTEFKSSFCSIRFAKNKAQSDSAISIPPLTAEFKENRTNYIVETPSVEDEYGTFYIAEEKEQSTFESLPEAKKTYFGAPSSYNFTLTGIVRDMSTGEALPYATVAVQGTTTGASTNADGLFTVLKVPSDTSVLVIQYMGYDKVMVYLTPQMSKKNILVEMHQSQNNLKTVTIVGEKEDVVLANRDDISVIKLTPIKLEQLPSFGEKDIMRSFQLMPGISAANESSSGLYVRGGTPDQNLVLYDGFTVYHVDHLYGFFSAFNTNAVKDVQLYKGGFESRFGGRLSSVTEITGKDGNQKRFNAGVDLSLLSMNAFVELPISDKFTSIVTFRKSYKGPIYNTIFKKFNNSDESADTPTTPSGLGGMNSQKTSVTSYFYDLNGKFTYRPTSKDVISLSIFSGIDKLDNSSSMNRPSFGSSSESFSMSSVDLTRYGNLGSSLKWSRKWNDKLYGNTVLSFSNYFSERDRSQERLSIGASDDSTVTKNGILENNDLRDYSFRSDYQYDIRRFFQLQFGAFGTYYDIQYSYAQNDTSTVLDKHNQALLSGGYLQTKLKFLKERIVIVPGLRTSWFETTGKLYQEPRASMSIGISKRISFKAATGKYYQFANRVTREDILSGSKDFWLLSDGVNIPVSSAKHYIAGFSYESNNYLFSAEAYYKKLDNLTEYSLRFNPSPMGVSYDENFFSGQGISRGIEFLAQKKSGKLNGWVSYTLGEAKNQFDVYSDSYYPANQDVTHEFKVIGLYSWKRWDFSATWIFATGRPYTSPSGAYTVTLLDGTTQDFYTVTDKNILRLPDYHRCDISASYKLLKGTKSEKKRREIGTLSFSIFNLYDRKNVWYRQYTIEDGSIIETDVNYLGITPNVSLSLKLW